MSQNHPHASSLAIAACTFGTLLSLELPIGAAPVKDHQQQQGRSKMEQRLQKHFQDAEVVAVVRPLALEASPGIWSGLLATFQGVRYQVIRYLKGSGPEQLAVLHPLVAASATADAKTPKLRESVFAPNSTLVVFARRQDNHLYCLDENDGVVPASEEVLALLSRLAGASQ